MTLTINPKEQNEFIALVFDDTEKEVYSCPLFYIKIDRTKNWLFSFEIYQVVNCIFDEKDGRDIPSELELYMSGDIKADGCSNLFFGEKNKDGYTGNDLHLCGKYFWKKHCELMAKIYEYYEHYTRNE